MSNKNLFEINEDSFNSAINETEVEMYRNRVSMDDNELYKIAAIREMSKMLSVYLEAILNNIHDIDGLLYERM